MAPIQNVFPRALQPLPCCQHPARQRHTLPGISTPSQAFPQPARHTFLRVPRSLQGVIVRTIRRLDELLRQLEDAMKSIGEVELAEKFEAAAQRIKRDVVFAASLYL